MEHYCSFGIQPTIAPPVKMPSGGSIQSNNKRKNMLCKHNEDVFLFFFLSPPPPSQPVGCIKSVPGKRGSAAASRCRVVDVLKGGVMPTLRSTEKIAFGL